MSNFSVTAYMIILDPHFNVDLPCFDSSALVDISDKQLEVKINATKIMDGPLHTFVCADAA